MREIIKISTLLCICMSTHVAAYASHNSDILRDECVDRRQREFASMRKEPKITVNGRRLGYYGFENSASAVILLDVSGTNVHIPRLNMSFTNLIKLHAAYNNLASIDDIGSETFPSLKYLNLSHNSIASFRSIVFSFLSEIEVLDLSHNCLTHFSYDHVLLRHENVKKLFLHDNLLHKVHGTPGIGPLRLRLDVLDLSSNYVEEFSDFGIEISVLRLERNLLRSLLIHHASDMHLNASHNHISTFSAEGSFSVLDLSFNAFRYLSLIEVNSAKSLHLQHNEIEGWTAALASDDYSSEISAEERVGIAVELLDLSHNNLSSMSELLHFREKVASINLESNRMSQVDIEDARAKFPNLKRLSFVGNPLTELDINEMRFHNDTRFLNLHIDFETVTRKSISLPLLLPLPTTTAVPATAATASEKIIAKIDDKGEVSIEYRKEQPRPWLLLSGALVISIFIASIIYYKQRNKAQMRFMRREFNEAENFEF